MCQINPGGITVLSLPPARCQRRYAKTQDLRSRVSYFSTQNIHNIIKNYLSYQKTRKSNVIDICQTCQKSTSYTLFANTYGTFVKIDYILSHKPTSTLLNQSVSFDHNRINVKVINKMETGKTSST